MIFPDKLWQMSPIWLTLALIICLVFIELGDKKIKRILIPLAIALIIVFLIIAVTNIFSTYSAVK